MLYSLDPYLSLKNIRKKFINLTAVIILSTAAYNIVNAKALCIEAFDTMSKSEQEILKSKKTAFNVTLDHVLKSGVENPDSKIGCYAGDVESYTVFKPIFDYAIKRYHKHDPSSDNITRKVTKLTFTKTDQDILSKSVISTRIRVARNLSSFPFPSSMTKKQREEVEKNVLSAIKKLPKEFQGKYYSIESLSNKEYEKMVKNHLLFKAKDKYLKSAGILDDWPTGRGAYISNDKKFMVWINEEDHLRIIYLTKGANMDVIYNKFTLALNLLEKDLKFAHDDKLGYLNSDSTNIGTAMRASFHMKFNNVDDNKIKSIAKKYNLAVRGTHGEHSKAIGGVYDISNAIRLGITREELIANLIKGSVVLVKEDQRLSS